MEKLIDLSHSTDERLSSRVIKPGPQLVKTASGELSPEIQKAIGAVKPSSGKVYILVNALGAGEYYGSNYNADYFSEKDLCPPDGRTASGYKTFLNAGIYRNHVNKDKEKSIGKVICAAYNHVMHRVELLIEIDETACEKQGHSDLFSRLQSGEKPAVSMGARVAFDVCRICGHKSKTRADYCNHCKDQLGQVLPDGRKVCVDNPDPVFFDLSIVVVGADRTSYVMMKVASRGASAPSSALAAEEAGLTSPAARLLRLAKVASQAKAASVNKQAKIEKELPALSAKIMRDYDGAEPDIPRSILDRLGAHHRVEESLAATTAAGVVLKPREFQRIILVRMGERDLADSLDRSNCCFCGSGEVDRSVGMDRGGAGVFDLVQSLLPLISSRSGFMPALAPRVAVIKLGSPQLRTPPRPIRTPLLDKIAAAYNGYREHVLENVDALVANVTSRDVSLLSAIGGGSFGTKTAGFNLVKESAPGGQIPTALLGAIPLAYLFGAHRGSGEQEKATEGFVQKHPVLATSLLLGLARLGKHAYDTGKLDDLLASVAGKS